MRKNPRETYDVEHSRGYNRGELTITLRITKFTHKRTENGTSNEQIDSMRRYD